MGTGTSASTAAPTLSSPSLSSTTDSFNVSLQRSTGSGASAADQVNHFPLGSIAGYMSRFFGDDQGQQRQHRSHLPQAPVEENLVENTNENLSSDDKNSGSGNSHEVEEKRWKPLLFSEGEPSMRKRPRTVLLEDSKVSSHEEDEDVSKDADWSHELATK